MNKETVKMVRKIVRAEVALESAKQRHKDSCIVETDPESIAPCNCGASGVNSAIDKALRELRLDD